jgi:hypothetical protein
MALAAKVLALLLSLSLFTLSAASATPAKKSVAIQTPIVAAETYRADLERAIAQLKNLEGRPPRRVVPILRTLAQTRKVRRGDGQTQIASGDEWARWAQRLKPSVTRSEVEKLRAAVELRKRALDEWSAHTYAPADAQTIVSQLEGSGQIRTGPTWWQQRVADFNKWMRTTWQNFLRWLGGLFPSAAPGQAPKIDPFWIRLFFYCTVFALLSLLIYLTWRAVGGRIGKRGTRRGVLAEGEDAELLLLPPDELRERARRFAEEGNFREALRHLYISLLLTLDARGVWCYDARRTNWEHIRALRGDQTRTNLIAPLSSVTRIFDRVRYGNADFARNDWTRFEGEVGRIEESVT